MAGSAADLARGLLAGTLTCDGVRERLSQPAGSLDGPEDLLHFLRHFVIDEDVRERDPGYALWQEGELRKLLR